MNKELDYNITVSPKNILYTLIGDNNCSKSNHYTILKASLLETKIGLMIAMTNEDALYLLEFIDRKAVKTEINNLKNKVSAFIVPGETTITKLIQQELQQYFEGTLTLFTTPLFLLGSSFQKKVWHTLQQIPYGQTYSYAQLACSLGDAHASRAVGRANGANQLAIIIPCHRVINSNGTLGGYGGGLSRKVWLLHHEKNLKNE